MTRLAILRTNSAEADICGIVLHILEKSPRAALAVQQAIDSTVSLLALNPWIGERYKHKAFSNLRRVLVTGYSSYSIYYQVEKTQLVVIRVLHNSRDAESTITAPDV